MAPSISVILYSFLLCVSQSVFGTIQRRLVCACAGVDTHQSRSVVKFCVAQFLRFLCAFFLSPLKGGISFCIVVASCGHAVGVVVRGFPPLCRFSRQSD